MNYFTLENHDLLKFAGLGLLLKKPPTLCAFSSVRLKDMTLIALKISSFLLPLIPFPFPSSSKCYGGTAALESVPGSLLLERAGSGSHLEGGGMLLHLLGSFHC